MHNVGLKRASMSSVTTLATSRPPGFSAAQAPSNKPSTVNPPPMKTASGAGRPTKLVTLAGDGPMKSKVFRTAYDAGDAVARELLDEGITLLGTAVVNVAVTVDIGAVVIGGGLGERFGPLVTDRVAESLRTLGLAGVAPVVVEASLGDHAGALGAARLVVEAGRDAS